jgi:hypothetical protein
LINRLTVVDVLFHIASYVIFTFLIEEARKRAAFSEGRMNTENEEVRKVNGMTLMPSFPPNHHHHFTNEMKYLRFGLY